MSTDPWARYRALLQEALDGAVSDIEFSHAELVREQVLAAGRDNVPQAGVVCLRAAEALGASAESALPGATALALVVQMGDVFLSLESQDGGSSLSTAWGMPRALNAGDAFFAAAQHTLLADEGEISVARRLRALSILDDAIRHFMEALNAPAEEATIARGEQPLLAAALLLAGLYAGADDDTMSRLRRLGSAWSGLDADALDAAIASDLKAALTAGT
jgi:hypothetical protein